MNNLLSNEIKMQNIAIIVLKKMKKKRFHYVYISAFVQPKTDNTYIRTVLRICTIHINVFFYKMRNI